MNWVSIASGLFIVLAVLVAVKFVGVGSKRLPNWVGSGMLGLFVILIILCAGLVFVLFSLAQNFHNGGQKSTPLSTFSNQ